MNQEHRNPGMPTVRKARRTVGVIFDLDGTLLDTLDDITDALNAVLVEFGWPIVSVPRIRPLIGREYGRVLGDVTGLTDPARIAPLMAAYPGKYQARMLRKTRLCPGVAALLDRLVQRAVPMSVLSNKPHEFAAPMCEAVLRRWPFVRIQGSIREARRKADPTIALEIAGEMQRSPSEILFVGDSRTDIRTARNAGMIPVAVTWGYGDRATLGAERPAHLLDAPMELLALTDF